MKKLSLTFLNGHYRFNEDTLEAIKYFKLAKLEHLIVNFTKNQRDKVEINYELFQLSYIPFVELIFDS